MNTIIPNELGFNFDLSDLPARANHVNLDDTLRILGGRRTRWTCLFRNGEIRGSVTIWWGHTKGDAAWACNKWNFFCRKSGNACTAEPSPSL